MNETPRHPDEFESVTRRLEAGRALPAAGFRGQLRRTLLARANRRGAVAPPRLHLRIAASATAGCLLLALAALSVAGAGPLAA